MAMASHAMLTFASFRSLATCNSGRCCSRRKHLRRFSRRSAFSSILPTAMTTTRRRTRRPPPPPPPHAAPRPAARPAERARGARPGWRKTPRRAPRRRRVSTRTTHGFLCSSSRGTSCCGARRSGLGFGLSCCFDTASRLAPRATTPLLLTFRRFVAAAAFV